MPYIISALLLNLDVNIVEYYISIVNIWIDQNHLTTYETENQYNKPKHISLVFIVVITLEIDGWLDGSIEIDDITKIEQTHTHTSS